MSFGDESARGEETINLGAVFTIIGAALMAVVIPSLEEEGEGRRRKEKEGKGRRRKKKEGMKVEVESKTNREK